MKTEKKTPYKKILIAVVVGAAVALMITMILLFLCATAISAGVFAVESSRGITILICVVGGFCGSIMAVRSVGKNGLLVGLGTGLLFFLLLILFGMLLLKGVSFGVGQLLILGVCLLSGVLAGLIGKKRKKRRI